MEWHKESQKELLRIVVLTGGNSAERSISLLSGTAVCEALSNRGHQVTCIDPAETDLAGGVDWNSFDVAFIALHGTFGEDGEVQAMLEC